MFSVKSIIKPKMFRFSYCLEEEPPANNIEEVGIIMDSLVSSKTSWDTEVLGKYYPFY